jgi:hypothetical protein
MTNHIFAWAGTGATVAAGSCVFALAAPDCAERCQFSSRPCRRSLCCHFAMPIDLGTDLHRCLRHVCGSGFTPNLHAVVGSGLLRLAVLQCMGHRCV